MGPTQPLVRRNVYELGGTWADPILWYARGVAAMQKRALDEPTSWRFYAAIHGFDATRWRGLGVLDPTETMPSASVRAKFWQQCQHGSWYFLPWHRGYLQAFEAVVRKAVSDAGGPADWTLPYWNYFKTGESALPPAFSSPDWPDGTGDNPLFVRQRYGPDGDGNVSVPLDQVDLDALADPDFTGAGGGGDPGFGGVDTGFSHGGPVHGALESMPHDVVHVLVGGALGQDFNRPGMMTHPDTAGLDPIFWLHHANIDRLWESWRRGAPSHTDPTAARWLDGPAQRAFAMPMPDGTTWTYAPQDVHEVADLGYAYDDLTPGTAVAPAPGPAERLVRLGAQAAAMIAPEGADVAGSRNVELVGANQSSMPVVGTEARTTVRLDTGMREKVTRSLAAERIEAEPDRVFLNLENVRGLADSAVFQVFVALPEGSDPGEHPERRAGSIGLFGVSKATRRDGDQAGDGLTFVLEITNIVDDLHLRDELADTLPVTIVARRPVSEAAQISIGRISIFRQGD